MAQERIQIDYGSISGGEINTYTFAEMDSLTAHTIDVKTALPNDYSKLSLDNFALTDVRQAYATDSTRVNNMKNILEAYDSQTGVLSLNESCTWADKYRQYVAYKVVCKYI